MSKKIREEHGLDATVVAELTVTSPDGAVIVRSFDTAWQLGKSLPMPVNIKFNRFVRKD